MYACVYCTVELISKLEEESQLMSHDLEDTVATPSESTVELAKSLIDCIEKYINGMYTHTDNTNVRICYNSHVFLLTECRLHLMLYVALRDGEFMCLLTPLYCKFKFYFRCCDVSKRAITFLTVLVGGVEYIVMSAGGCIGWAV